MGNETKCHFDIALYIDIFTIFTTFYNAETTGPQALIANNRLQFFVQFSHMFGAFNLLCQFHLH